MTGLAPPCKRRAMRATFFCIDGHTCGNPVRVVTGGSVPRLEGATMFERRQDFLSKHDWVRNALMFEPRGHDIMSGSILYPPLREDCDVALLFIETSGCLPMCGHGTIGTVTTIIEHGLVTPKTPGVLRLDTPAGLVEARYVQKGPFVESVRITNVPSFLRGRGYEVEVEGMGKLTVDVAYGGNFYAIVEKQANYPGLDAIEPSDVIRLSPRLRAAFNARHWIVHPENPALDKLTHVMWTGRSRRPRARARATRCSMATRRSTVRPAAPEPRRAWPSSPPSASSRRVTTFVHESIIGSTFSGRIEGARQGRQSRCHHSFDRGLGSGDGPEHHRGG